MINGVADGHPEVVWSALPPTYQNDINDIVQTFGKSMDPQLWDQILGVVQKIQQILETKGEFIANVPMLQGQGNAVQCHAPQRS